MPQAKVKAIPDSMHPLTPHLICTDAGAAIEFYKKAFNAVEEHRMPGPDGQIMHACVRIGGAALFLVAQMPQWGALSPKTLKGSPVTIHHFVENVDAMVAQAVATGAKAIMPVADMFWGDRYGKLEDPFGYQWSVATHLRDMSPEEIEQAMMKEMSAHCGDGNAGTCA
jgi:PhnB protein